MTTLTWLFFLMAFLSGAYISYRITRAYYQQLMRKAGRVYENDGGISRLVTHGRREKIIPWLIVVALLLLMGFIILKQTYKW